jgi:alpha-beta hydrolase superfamily lysophospholipase
MGMRYVREFKGFAGVKLESDDIGSADDPSIILLHGFGQTRKVWEDVADALEQAGRHVINVDLRGHGGSDWPSDARYDFDAYVEDLRAVLGQMRTRPVVVADAGCRTYPCRSASRSAHAFRPCLGRGVIGGIGAGVGKARL